MRHTLDVGMRHVTNRTDRGMLTRGHSCDGLDSVGDVVCQPSLAWNSVVLFRKHRKATMITWWTRKNRFSENGQQQSPSPYSEGTVNIMCQLNEGLFLSADFFVQTSSAGR